MTPTHKPVAVLAFAGLAVAGALALTGCTINIAAPGSHSSMMGADSEDARGTLSDADIMFLQMMIPHHQQAVDMGTLAVTRASNPQVKALAAQIKAEQAPEIAQMKQWLTDAGLPTTASADMMHSMGGGVLSDAQMTALENASGPAFDKLYLEGMIGHHEGAIAMVSMLKTSDNPSTTQLGKAIISSQTAQIAQMKALLATL
jgi:uncharacterized protein (DUF305 family)